MNRNKPNKRNDAQIKHRLELLQATAWVIANHGLSGTTVDRIQARSGLSRGMLNLHFGTKENLIAEVLNFVSNEYKENWVKAIEGSSDQPEKRLMAIFMADLSPIVLNPTNAGVWTAVRADRSFSEKNRDTVETRNPEFFEAILSCCENLCAEGGYNVDTNIAAKAFTNLLEGLYIDFNMHPDNFDREEAVLMCASVAKAFFPNHTF
jgi:TetR/AcrR family transcriptional repressor of bet genes